MLSQLLGRRVKVKAVKAIPQGFFMEKEGEEFFLPAKLAPAGGVSLGEELELFLYRDSEDRLTATTEVPLAQVGDIRRLRVKDAAPQGFYLDWGLSKDLLLPRSQIKTSPTVGQRVLVMVYFDEKGQNIAATALFDEVLGRADEDLKTGQEWELTVLRYTDHGVVAAFGGRYQGLIFRDEIQRSLNPGEKLRGWIKNIRPDSKIDLTLRSPDFQTNMDVHTRTILSALEKAGGFLPLHDKSPPEEIRSRLGMSKKDFKKAAGTLFRERMIKITEKGLEIKT